MLLNFVYVATPQSQGSMRAFIPQGWTRPILTSTNKNLKKWREGLGIVAKDAVEAFVRKGTLPVARGTPIRVHVRFTFLLPKSHKGRKDYKSTKPDVDKLLRAVLDGMTGIIYEDDAQVAVSSQEKVFSANGPESVEVWVDTL